MPDLVIVESPTKAKTLGPIVGKDFEIAASMGHIRDLPKSGLQIDVDNNFEPTYEVPEKAKKVLNSLKKSIKDSQVVYLATDPDREGEAIAWHLYELLKPKRGKKPEFKRVVFHEITKDAILDAFSHPGELNLNLVDAQQARRVLDRLVGYKLSPLLWKKVRYGLSAGRVQSVAVRLVVERERERTAFVPEEYWVLKGLFNDEKGKREFSAELYEKNGKKFEVKNEKQSKEIEKVLISDTFSIQSVEKSERKKNPYPPFKTSTLQQSMSNVYGFTANRTMRAAQSLFEKGYITYHRTDSLTLSAQFIKNVRAFIGKEFGNDYLPSEAVNYKNKSKNAQEAHEAIRPTNLNKSPNSKDLGADEKKVYTLVWKRAIESQMAVAIYDQTSIKIKSDSGYGFRASGSVIKFYGWMAVSNILNLSEEENNINELPSYNEGEVVLMKIFTPEQKFTQPPARYSDASLIKKLEELEIGRPSTYAPTLATIQARGYVEKEGRYFIPKDVAYVVNDLLVEHFSNVVDYKFTADMEEDLDAIADGEKEWVPVIREFYKPFDKNLTEKEEVLKKTDVTNLGETDEDCPECGHKLIIKLGKYGKFLSCSNYPKCEFAKPMEEDADANQDYGKCPNCEDGNFILKQGKFGKFLACSNYPKCKTTQTYLEKIGMQCPKCGEGDVVIKKAKRRKFFGCSRYPDCDWSSWKDPRGAKGKSSEQESFNDEPVED